MVDEKTKQAIEQIRTEWKKGDDQRDAGLPVELPEVTRINDIAYGPDPKWNLLDIYLPVQQKVLIYWARLTSTSLFDR